MSKKTTSFPKGFEIEKIDKKFMPVQPQTSIYFSFPQKLVITYKPLPHTRGKITEASNNAIFRKGCKSKNLFLLKQIKSDVFYILIARLNLFNNRGSYLVLMFFYLISSSDYQ